MKLQEKLTALRESFEDKAPKDVLDIMHRATDNLRNSGIIERAVKVGDRAPDFSLKNAKGKDVSLQALLSKGLAVLSFYRGKW